ncbi:hypothetical protein GIY62_31890 [Burkholderia plantarii]|uniref:hypothetical protein n=1 Tax=Burkholderia plantarii TaxID=41899 RepID=UPI00272B6C03|nr:hypothetical protein [Burkholderia plantarii]WLE62013.1 hypothetical protein GIY62_31890 [Burkholderia plantarii]
MSAVRHCPEMIRFYSGAIANFSRMSQGRSCYAFLFSSDAGSAVCHHRALIFFGGELMYADAISPGSIQVQRIRIISRIGWFGIM